MIRQFGYFAGFIMMVASLQLSGCHASDCLGCNESATCAEAEKVAMVDVSPDDVSPLVTDNVSYYENLTGQWSVTEECAGQVVRNVEVYFRLPPGDEVQLILGPGPGVGDDEIFACHALATVVGNVTISREGASEASILPLNIEFREASDARIYGYSTEGEAVDDRASVFVLSLNSNGDISAWLSQGTERALASHATPTTGSCSLRNWHKLEPETQP